MSPRTTFLSRLIGLYSVLASLSMLTHRQASFTTANAIIHNPALLLTLSVMTVVAGLAIILGHNVWSGGALPVIVTLVGWLALIKGLVFLFLSPEGAVDYFAALHYEHFFYLYTSISLLLGAYLTYAGFRSASH